MTGCVERLAVISFDSDCATRLAIHAPALSYHEKLKTSRKISEETGKGGP